MALKNEYLQSVYATVAQRNKGEEEFLEQQSGHDDRLRLCDPLQRHVHLAASGLHQ